MIVRNYIVTCYIAGTYINFQGLDPTAHEILPHAHTPELQQTSQAKQISKGSNCPSKDLIKFVESENGNTSNKCHFYFFGHRINHIQPRVLDITTCYNTLLQRHLDLISCLSALLEFGLDDVLHLLELK